MILLTWHTSRNGSSEADVTNITFMTRKMHVIIITFNLYGVEFLMVEFDLIILQTSLRRWSECGFPRIPTF